MQTPINRQNQQESKRSLMVNMKKERSPLLALHLNEDLKLVLELQYLNALTQSSSPKALA